jgi:hypothetical protein
VLRGQIFAVDMGRGEGLDEFSNSPINAIVAANLGDLPISRRGRGERSVGGSIAGVGTPHIFSSSRRRRP